MIYKIILQVFTYIIFYIFVLFILAFIFFFSEWTSGSRLISGRFVAVARSCQKYIFFVRLVCLAGQVFDGIGA